MAKETKKSSGAKKKADKKTPATQGAAPLIDPGQSAAAAAALVGRKVSVASPASGPKTESSTFKNLKDSLSKPHSQTIGGVLDKIAPSGNSKFGGPAGFGKQVGHNQMVGGDAARRNVPRRTNG